MELHQRMYLLVPMSYPSAEFSEIDALGLGLSPPNDDDDNNSIIYHTVLGSYCMVVIWSPCSAVSCTLKRFPS